MTDQATITPTIAPPAAPLADVGVTLTVDGKSVTVPKGTNVLEAARKIGVDISAFCFHPGLSIAAQCRQCLVSIEKNPKLQPSCQQTVGEGMVVHTTDPQSTLARKQMLEFTLVNHPIDCPICDKAGECTLQKLYFEDDNANSRVDTPKVHKAKVVDLGPTVVLDQERCILCSRCIRTCDEVAGEHQLEFAHRGDHEILTTAPGAKLDNPYSLNVVDVCPVGALTAKDFRFTMRAWELEATPSVCNGCATGCNIEIHHKNERAWRLIPRHNADVNQYWMCDDGRMTYHDLREDRLAAALIDGLPAGWERSIEEAAAMLASSAVANTGVVLSAIHSNEDNFALAKFAQSGRAGHVFVTGRPADPSRADDKLRDADLNANTAGAMAIASSLGLGPVVKSLADLDAGLKDGSIKTLIVLGDALPVTHEWRLPEIDLIVISSHERGVTKHASIALPAAAWAEAAGTVTNRQGRVQRMHPAFPPPGQALPAWQAIAKLANASGGNFVWANARDVFNDMVSQIAAFKGASWGREVRPLQLRFAASRG